MAPGIAVVVIEMLVPPPVEMVTERETGVDARPDESVAVKVK